MACSAFGSIFERFHEIHSVHCRKFGLAGASSRTAAGNASSGWALRLTTSISTGLFIFTRERRLTTYVLPALRSTSTLMYGHIESTQQVASHLTLLRDIQKETGGFTEFVPLGFIHERNILFNHLDARPGSSASEDLRLLAVARLFFRPWITNIQVSWVKMGPKLAQMGLMSGANDFGGTLMEESISRESGSQHGENLPQEDMRRLIREIDRTPVERRTP